MGMTLPDHDMYRYKIWPLGETGWGMSVSYHQEPWSEFPERFHPTFTLFHESEPNPQQCLVMFNLHGTEGRPQVNNIFDERVAEVEAANAHSQRAS